ncbi:hypothetical protein M231_04345 [Tremella mesenterica]|uniref:Myb-like domain-containing protein n=1 Tax=Tremella mesenterica TaxID=5217 RepID=A0A4Q1BL38_TREME|nr:uncharacterized protein TREMEDRAFT_59159 [Tremella mesenterica DSM 1558]EIW72999.1 hypothetical protein TREMEDRAFT_59159 [Tremella mesenterica DSM 1558]RXK38436.1 hypothetical protein M231_04345 [Tremella mesenterica]
MSGVKREYSSLIKHEQSDKDQQDYKYGRINGKREDDSTPEVSPKKMKSEGDSPTTPEKKVRGEGKKLGPGPAWTGEMRLRLFEVYQEVGNVDWGSVAQKMGGGMTAAQCRKQWQRATGTKIRRALREE